MLGLKVKVKFKNLSFLPRRFSRIYFVNLCSSKASKDSLLAFRFYLQRTFIIGQDSTSVRFSLYKRPRFVRNSGRNLALEILIEAGCQVLKTCLEDVVKRIILVTKPAHKGKECEDCECHRWELLPHSRSHNYAGYSRRRSSTKNSAIFKA